MPKNQDIGILFDRSAHATKDVIGTRSIHDSLDRGKTGIHWADNRSIEGITGITATACEQAKKWDGWKTAGLKPAHEPITIFQKPLEGTYIQNIAKYGCGGMNIDACRVPISRWDRERMDSKASKNPTDHYSHKADHIYGEYALEICAPSHPTDRFPPNVVLDEGAAKLLDEQTGTTKSSGGKNSRGSLSKTFGDGFDQHKGEHTGGLGDVGGGSKIFPVMKYQPKIAPRERKLPNGERNPHLTVKPVDLIKWLIKLLTPLDGTTIDITAGSGTHGVACEQLNQMGYCLKWVDVELLNTISEPYCNITRERLLPYTN